MDRDLRLPIIREELLPPALRSMDEINAWIEEDYKNFFDREIYEQEKRSMSVDVPFSLGQREAGRKV